MSSIFLLNSGANNVLPFSGGVSGVAAQTSIYTVSIGGAWHVGDSFQYDIITAAQTISAGMGRITTATGAVAIASGAIPVFALTLSERVYFIAGTVFYGSDNNDPTAWEAQAVNALSVDVAKDFATPDNLVSLAAYQGRMAVFGRRNIQIWVIDATPANFALQQVLANIGTWSPSSAESIGDLDVLFGSDTGVRSLRVRDLTLNAFVGDIGSAIDSLITASIAGQSPAQLSAACAIVEPSANRYWLYLNGQIYVFSYFQSSKISAWGIYTPTYFVGGVQKTFVPSKFVIYQGQCYFRANSNADGNDHVFVYGGLNGTTYDITQAIVEIPWLDGGDSTKRKGMQSLDYMCNGLWEFFGSMDYFGVAVNNAPLQIINTTAYPSFQFGQFGWTDDGYHFKVRAVSGAIAQAAKLSLLAVTYNEKQSK